MRLIETPSEFAKRECNGRPFVFGTTVHVRGFRIQYTLHPLNLGWDEFCIVRGTPYDGAGILSIPFLQLLEVFQYRPTDAQDVLPEKVIKDIERMYARVRAGSYIIDRRKGAYSLNVRNREFARVLVLDMDDIINTIARGYAPVEEPNELLKWTLRQNDLYRAFYYAISQGQFMLWKLPTNY